MLQAWSGMPINTNVKGGRDSNPPIKSNSCGEGTRGKDNLGNHRQPKS